MSEIVTYVPRHLTMASGLPDVHSTWKGLEHIIPDIIERFCIGHEAAIEFGVWYGYSTAALAQCFDYVKGIDTFLGDHDAGTPSDLWSSASATLIKYENVQLVQSDYQSFINKGHHPVDLIHIDIVHDYESTFELGRWSCAHADVVIFHDTDAFPDVRRAVSDLADETGRVFFNYPHHHGLGILVNL